MRAVVLRVVVPGEAPCRTSAEALEIYDRSKIVEQDTRGAFSLASAPAGGRRVLPT